jgi:glycosyltransferase involved in cell wall biosynthesis
LVIASRIGGIPELVEGCKGAFLFTAGDETQLADTMERLNSLSKEEALKLGIDNHEKIKSKFGDETVALKSFLNVCENLVK